MPPSSTYGSPTVSGSQAHRGLKALLRQRLNTALTCGPPNTWKALVVDQHSKKLLESVYKVFEVLHMNVTSIDDLMSPRTPQPTLDAVYLLAPTTQSVERVIADFADGRRTYRGVHLYFVDGLEDRLADRITRAIPEDALQTFVELYCNFWPIESQVFSLQTPEMFFSLFGNPGGVVAAELARDRLESDFRLIGRGLINLLATLGEAPTIRYYSPTHHPPLGALAAAATPGSSHASVAGAYQPGAPSPNEPASAGSRWRQALNVGRDSGPTFTGDQLCRRLAERIQIDLDAYQQLNPDFPPATNTRPRAVLFVVDRSMDPVAPFLHEFTYQAMVNDLLDGRIKDGDEYRYKVKTAIGLVEERVAKLNEEDPIWTEIRHMHMKEAIDKLMNDFNRFTQEHAGFNSNGNQEGTSSLNDMKDMLASLPQYQEQRDKVSPFKRRICPPLIDLLGQFSVHLDMAQECMTMFGDKKLPQAANVEQCCATGVTPEGKNPKTLVEEMVPLLADRDISSKDKVRIIALYILFRDGVPDEDRKRLFQHARLSISEQDTVNNLVYLGAKVVRPPNERAGRTRVKGKYASSEDDYELSRYRPFIKQLLEEQATNRLDATIFPYFRDVPPEASIPSAASHRTGSLRPAALGSLRSDTNGSASGLGGSIGGSLRSARPTWHKAPSARVEANTASRQRYIIFVAGGITHSEQRLAYLIGEALNKEVIIGSTHIVTPESFMNDLKALGRAGVGGNPPNGRPLSPYVRPPQPPRQISFQDILDQRIWSEPVGPPPIAPPPPGPMPGQSHHMKTGSGFLSGGGDGGRSASPASTSGKLSLSSLKKDKKDKDKGEDGGDGSNKKKKGLFKMNWG